MVLVRPDQWPGLIIRLQADDQFVANICNNFGLTLASGVYGMLADASADIFRCWGMGLLAKWVDNHIFFRIQRTHLPSYNLWCAEWCCEIQTSGGCRQEGSWLWYGGNGLPSGLAEVFNEDCSTSLHNLLHASPQSPVDSDFTYVDADINELSLLLSIKWQSTKMIPFGEEVPYLGFHWNLCMQMVHLPDEKKAKYLAAIAEWKGKRTHNLLKTQRLHRKLQHAALVIPAGCAYLTNMEAMLASFNNSPFLPHTPMWGIPDDLAWWQCQLWHTSISIPIPRPCPLVKHRVFSDASSGFSMAIMVGTWWRVWWWVLGWRSQGRDIQCAEAISFKLTICIFALSRKGDHVIVYGDNRGVIEGWWKRCSTNRPTNHVFQRILQLLEDCDRTVMLPLGAHTLPVPSYLTQSLSPVRLGPSSSISDPRELARATAIKCLVWARNANSDHVDTMPPASKLRKISEARPHNLIILPAGTLSARGPAPYPLHLTPSPLSLRPHCLAKDWLRKWTPVSQPPEHTDTVTFIGAEQEQVKEMMLHAWEEDTRTGYGAGLLMWHCFCNEKGVLEESRALASQELLSVFVAHLAAAYSGRMISGYVNGVQAWHILHGLRWVLNKQEMDTMLKEADKLMPNASKQKKHQPYIPEFITMIKAHLDMEKPLNTAVYACLTTCFYMLARLGEFTVRTLRSFSPNTHITPQHLSYNQDHNRLKVMVLHLPRTKAVGNEGKDVYWASQEGDTDMTKVLAQHLRINQP